MKKNDIFGGHEKADFFSENLEDVHKTLLRKSAKGSLVITTNSI
jgi:hypothetical protein